MATPGWRWLTELLQPLKSPVCFPVSHQAVSVPQTSMHEAAALPCASAKKGQVWKLRLLPA